MTLLRTPAAESVSGTSPSWHRLGAWLVLALSAALHVGLRLEWHPAGFSDVAVYRAEAQALRDGIDLYGPLPGVHGLGTYPPFAAAAFLPLLLLPVAVAGVLSLLVNLGLLVCASYLAVRRLPLRVEVAVAAPLLAAATLWCEPVMQNNGYGQVNLAVLCLVLWDFSLPEGSRWRGVGVGLAAAVKVTPGIFIVHLLLTGRLRAALGAAATLGATLLVSLVVAPSATWAYWTHHVLDPSRVGRIENSVNQSVRGWLARVTHSADASAVTVVATAAVLVAGLAAARYVHRREGDGAALLVVALTGLLVSPISWSHHWVWCVPLTAWAWYEARALLWPTVLVFWSYAVWLVPHGDAVELGLDPVEVALSGWYVAYAVVAVDCLVLAARGREGPDPLGGGPGPRREAGRADRI